MNWNQQADSTARAKDVDQILRLIPQNKISPTPMNQCLNYIIKFFHILFFVSIRSLKK